MTVHNPFDDVKCCCGILQHTEERYYRQVDGIGSGQMSGMPI